MAGAKPRIQVQNTVHSLQSTPYTHSLVHHHQHMHQHTHQQAFTIPPAPTIMETQDINFNTHLPRGTTRHSFAPVTAFHRATQKSFRTKQRRWGALHVRIAWKIYYHKLKKMQQKPNSLHRELTPESPSAISHPDSVQHKQSEQSSCVHPDPNSRCGQSAYRNTKPDRSETGKTCDLSTSSPASCHFHTTKKEKLELPPNLHWKAKHDEKEKQRDNLTDKTKDLPLREKSWDRTVTPELDGRRGGSLDRKRQPECDGFAKVKRVKQETGDDLFDSSKTLHTDPAPFSTTHQHPSSRTIPVPHINISDLSALYPHSSRCNVTNSPGGLITYPGAEMFPYQTASWEPTWDTQNRKDLHSRQNDCALNTYKWIRIPLVAQRKKEAFHGFFTPPLYFPLALRQQETAYHRERESLHSCHENHHSRRELPHPGFLATSYLGP